MSKSITSAQKLGLDKKMFDMISLSIINTSLFQNLHY